MSIIPSIVLFMSASAAPLQPVGELDLGRYAGRWYEIASIPQVFQRGCSCTSATYTLRDDGAVDVVNSCRRLGFATSVHGRAVREDPRAPARLRVDFGYGRPGSYVVVGLDAEYRWAVVSSDDGRALWILSRERTLAPELLGSAVEAAARQVDLTDLTFTNQTGCESGR